MNDDAEDTELDDETAISRLEELIEELRLDRSRLNGLLRNKTLNTTSALAGEVVQGIVPSISDIAGTTYQALSSHQVRLEDLEDAGYSQFPQAFALLVQALVAKEIVTQATADEVMTIVRNGQEIESMLSATDGGRIVEALTAYEQLLQAQANGQPSSPLQSLQELIARVKEITDGGTAEAESESEQDSVETSAEPLEETT